MNLIYHTISRFQPWNRLSYLTAGNSFPLNVARSQTMINGGTCDKKWKTHVEYHIFGRMHSPPPMLLGRDFHWGYPAVQFCLTTKMTCMCWNQWYAIHVLWDARNPRVQAVIEIVLWYGTCNTKDLTMEDKVCCSRWSHPIGIPHDYSIFRSQIILTRKCYTFHFSIPLEN